MKEDKKDNKPWYEKLNILIGIIVGIFSILGIRVFNDIFLINSEPNIQSSSDQEKTNHQEDILDDTSQINSFFLEKILINQNFDQIRKLKAKYTMLDCKIIHGNNLGLYFAEKACYVFRNVHDKMGYELIGDKVYPDKVIILDYSNDEILYVFTPKNNTIEYIPENQKEFYGVIFNDNYEICVTPPFKVVGGDGEYRPDICLDRKGSKFSFPIQIYTYIHDLKSDKEYSIPSTDYEIKIAYRSIKYGYEENALYSVNVLDSDMISFDEDFTYFSLNEDYEMYIYLYRKIGGEYESEYVAEQIFDGSITDSNFIEIVFDVEDINNN